MREKVFENETEAFGHLIAGPQDWRGKQAEEWLKRRGVNVEAVMLKALPRILERLPAEQVVQAMGDDVIEAVAHKAAWSKRTPPVFKALKDARDEALARAEGFRDRLATIIDEAFGLHEVMAVDDLLTTLERELHESHRNHAAAIARAEKAEADAAASWQFAELARVKAKEADERAFRASERANSAERERDAMHAAAEELRAQGAECVFCKGTGRSCGDKYCGWPRCASCKVCNGTGRKTEESDGKNNEATDTETNSEAAVLRAQTGPEPAHRRDDPALPDGEGRGLPRSVHLAEQDTAGEADRGASKDPVKPPGVPASATIWAEVEVVTRCAAWFEPRKNQWCPDGVVLDNPTGRNFWTPENSDKYWHQQTAAQCRQLYERGMAEQEKTDLAARLAAQANGLCGECKTRRYDPKSNIAMCTECLAAVDFPGPEWRQEIREETKDLAETKPRPACIYSHIADTDWTVIEGRAVWREQQKVLFIASSDRLKTPWANYQSDINPSLAMQCDVPQSLFLAARRWMGWEPPLTPVDLTELREVANKRREYLALAPDARSLLQEKLNDRAVLAAVEKLLSGGAP